MSDTLPPMPASVTDRGTAQMCKDRNHCCPACSIEVRNLAAVAHNANGAVGAALDGSGSWERARRKLATLGDALARWEDGTLKDHFEILREYQGGVR